MTTMLNYGLIVTLFVCWIGLFAVKDTSRDASMRIAELSHEIEAEEAAIRSLRTDWAILNEPSYLQGLARTHLALGSIAPAQIVTMLGLPGVPLHDRRPSNGGTFYASAPVGSSYSADRLGAFMNTRASGIPVSSQANPYTDLARPALRPEFGG